MKNWNDKQLDFMFTLTLLNIIETCFIIIYLIIKGV